MDREIIITRPLWNIDETLIAHLVLFPTCIYPAPAKSPCCLNVLGERSTWEESVTHQCRYRYLWRPFGFLCLTFPEKKNSFPYFATFIYSHSITILKIGLTFTPNLYVLIKYYMFIIIKKIWIKTFLFSCFPDQKQMNLILINTSNTILWKSVHMDTWMGSLDVKVHRHS